MSVELFVPESYKQASDAARAEVCNGCGPFGKFDFVPDSIYGLDISAACMPHDWAYTFGATLADKEEADRIFLNNMLRLIEGAPSWWDKMLRPFRRRRALLYYEMVVAFGAPAYWAGKNQEANLTRVNVT